MLFSSGNIINELQREKERIARQQRALIDEVHTLIQQGETGDAELLHRLSRNQGEASASLVIFSEQDAYSLESIRRICVRYRLRFLPSAYYRPDFPYEAFVKIREVERRNEARIQDFYIMAPAEAFRLEKKADPLLFVPLTDGRFLLVHQWGKELSVFRKIISWPLRNFKTLLITILSVSLLLSMSIPVSWFFNEQLMHISYSLRMYLFFLFTFAILLSAVGFHIMQNKMVSEDAWNSKYL